LAVEVVAPGLDRVVGGKGEGVVAARVDGDDVLQALHLPEYGADGAAAVSELAEDAAAPGVDLAVLQQGEAN
jgi:hypothetical protein